MTSLAGAVGVQKLIAVATKLEQCIMGCNIDPCEERSSYDFFANSVPFPTKNSQPAIAAYLAKSFNVTNSDTITQNLVSIDIYYTKMG